MTNELPLIERAARIAAQSHIAQKRKSDGSPYIVHPFMVARLLTAYQFEDDVVAAALVHDVLEDTDVTEAELRDELGDTVVDIVLQVSEDMSLPWEERKTAYAAHVAEASEGVKAVSIGDKIHNLQSMLIGWSKQGDSFWEHFTRGIDNQIWLVQTLLAAYKTNWSHPLVDRYEALAQEFVERSKQQEQ